MPKLAISRKLVVEYVLNIIDNVYSRSYKEE